jgi:superfamily II DNA or RNA helicase
MSDKDAKVGRRRPAADSAGAPVPARTDDPQGLAHRVLQTLSVLYEPTSEEVLRDCLAQSESGAEVTPLRAALELLLGQGQVERTPEGLRCSATVCERATRQTLAEGRFELVARAVKRVAPVALAWNRSAAFRTREQGLREVRIAFYRQDSRALQQALWELQRQFPPDGLTEPPLVAICAHPFEPAWFLALPGPMRAAAAGEMLAWSALHLEPCLELMQCLEQDPLRMPAAVRVFMADTYILQGRFQVAAQVLGEIEGPARAVRLGWMAFLRGQNDEALGHFESGLHDLRREQSKADAFYRSYGGLFYLLALLKSGSDAHLERLHTYVAAARAEPLWRDVCAALRRVETALHGSPEEAGTVALPLPADTAPDGLALLELVCAFLVRPEVVPAALLEGCWRRWRDAGYEWAASEAAAMLAARSGRDECRQYAEGFRARTGVVGLVGSVVLCEAWERALDALGALAQPPTEDPEPAPETRFVWFLKPGSTDAEQSLLRPAEQHRTAKGAWTRGRSVPLGEIYTLSERPPCMTEQDHRICAAITARTDRWKPDSVEYSFRPDLALGEMVGHPLLFWEDAPRLRLELVRGEPELIIRAVDGMIELSMIPADCGSEKVLLLRDSPTRLRLVHLDEVHRRVGAILQGGLRVPARAEERVRAAVAPLAARLVVQSDIGSIEEGTTRVDADATIHVHLLPAGDGLTVELLVQPFGRRGPTYVPARGGTTVVADVDGRRLEAGRDLDLEQSRAQAVVDACASLTARPHSDWTWNVETPEECLDLLLQLRSLPANVHVEWPEGRALSVSRVLGLGDLHLCVRRQRDWFSVSGDVQVNEELTLNLTELIRLTGLSSGRFIAIGDGQYLALTEEFRRRIEDMTVLGEVRRDGLRFHPLAAAALDDVARQAGTLDADADWHENLARLEGANQLVPVLPAGLNAELRDYQLEGYRWLCRLAAWGAGACLADDMGLGKTVQALSVMLDRAGAGPSLVIAPTSVCLNWRDEASRFTPSLKIRLFGEGDRQEMLDNLRPFDLVICSYGLMQTGRDALADIAWQTIVLDEAQAIKNPRAKRSLAAFRLNAGFRVITTGTPIENNLGELWSLFRFINPGLLGSWEHFNERFAVPVERDEDVEVRQRLRRVIAPFILRRTKKQVLQELPPRTEVLQHVQLSERERAFYEALRRESLRRIGEQQGGPGARRMQILAEITRLRQACCNSRLVLATSDIPSAKLEAFDGIVEDLLANRHKALVFSQFVTHLTLIREHLDRRGVKYQYLDGSTPQKERAERVAAFQRGEGDIFLISLKAGGTGLNLTAADYVVHLDPWWNPAVEDQASDRAHRIGQHQAVTIYRLVAADTIEDRIVELHHRKRDLADSLLSGNEVPPAVSAEELLRLMSEL